VTWLRPNLWRSCSSSPGALCDGLLAVLASQPCRLQRVQTADRRDPFNWSFCAFVPVHSNNMLYPKEDKKRKILMYACRNCGHEEDVKDPKDASQVCVYTNEIKLEVYGGRGVNPEVTLDPTLFRNKKARCCGFRISRQSVRSRVWLARPCCQIKCPKCAHNEAVYFTPSLETMELNFVCCNKECNHHWVSQQRK
jgi:DNA-directed RNA polymerase II subunit RPB9